MFIRRHKKTPNSVYKVEKTRKLEMNDLQPAGSIRYVTIKLNVYAQKLMRIVDTRFTRKTAENDCDKFKNPDDPSNPYRT